MEKKENRMNLSCVSTGSLTQSTVSLTPQSAKEKEALQQAEDPEVLCGLGSYTPQWLQKLATPKLFLLVYSLCGMFQGAQFTYLVGSLHTLEKRFAYDSKISGLIMISDEFGPIVLGSLIGYFGGATHRPKLITFGMILGAISSFVMAIPYLLYGSKETSEAFSVVKLKGINAQFCDPEENSIHETCLKSTTFPAVSLLFLGNFLKGLCSLVYYTIGTSYLDDNVKKKNSPFYLDKTEDRTFNENEDSDTLCGMGSFKPSWLQRFATPKMFLFIHSILGVLQGAMFTYMVGCLSTLEKRYGYDTKTSGIIMLSEDISTILLGVFVGYFGGKSHRPRIVAIGMMAAVLGCFLMSLPYYIYGKPLEDVRILESMNKTDSLQEYCQIEEKDDCHKSTTTTAISLLFIGNFIKGYAALAFYTIGTTYLDDSVEKKNSPMYFGTLFALRLLGPAVGFLLSSFCLQYYEDPFYDPGFGQKDPRWVGAWWLGFVILGVLIFVFSLPMILFPRRFPSAKLPEELRNKKKKEEKKEKEEKVHETVLQQIIGMLRALKRLGQNPILVCHYLGGVFRLNGVIGYYVLLPKYMEMQFRQSASKASLYSGPASIIGMQFGILFGGYAIRRFKPRPRALTGGILIAETFSVMALVACMFITCPLNEMAGTTVLDTNRLNLTNSCNANCSCTTKSYTPVCGPDGTSTYFSPCFAGCSSYNKTDNKEIFTDCKCVHDEYGDFTEGSANKNYCDSECQWLITFIVILTVGKFLSSTSRVGNTIVTLRCVDPEDKSIALGTLSGVFSLLAFIPYPLIYGALTDASCIVWEESCDKTGNCWIYDTDKFRYLLHGVSAMFVFCGCVTDIFVWILSPRLRNLYDEEDEEEKPKIVEKDANPPPEAKIANSVVPLGVFKNGFDNGALQSVIENEENNTRM